ncbi:ionotropic receptor 25a-like [Photinus pyralis]|nr:ionotropic receptor 25a-like [Photinus pyralis]
MLTTKPYLAAAFYFDLALRAFMSLRNLISDQEWPIKANYSKCGDLNTTIVRKDVDLRQYFKKVSIPPAFGDLYMNDNESSYMFTMDLTAVEFNNISRNASVIQLGKWNATRDSNIVFQNSENMVNYRADIVHRVVTVVQPPFVYFNNTTGYFGYCIDLMDKIANYLNIKYEIHTVQNGGFGYINDSGEWNGVVQELIQREAEIGLGAMPLMSERETAIDFTVPYYELVGLAILMKYNTPHSSLFKFVTVMEYDVWLCILSSFTITSLFLWIYERFSPYSYSNNRLKYVDDEDKREFNLKECLWFCLTSLTPQGGGAVPKSLSGRMLAATWWLFGFIVIASYTANLAAFLTISRLEEYVESLDDLAKQFKVQYAPHQGSDADLYFRRMAEIEKMFYNIWKSSSLNSSLNNFQRAQLAVWDYPIKEQFIKMYRIMSGHMPLTFAEAVDKVRLAKPRPFAYIGDATDIKYLALTSCDVRIVGEEFFRKPYALAVPQGSPLRDQLNAAILHFQREGELLQLKKKWWDNNPFKVQCDQPENDTGGINFQNIGGLFATIFLGIFIAAIVFGIEYWYYKYHKVKNAIGIIEEVASIENFNNTTKHSSKQ